MNHHPNVGFLPEILRSGVKRYLEHYLDIFPGQKWPEAIRESLPRVWASSEFVARHCVSDSSLLGDLIESGDLTVTYPDGTYQDRLMNDLDGVQDESDLMSRLRRFRCREMVRIAWRDLAGWAALDETLNELSYLACTCVWNALQHLDEWQSWQYGVPMGQDSGTRQSLIVIGMGKLGAEELNFSSDIDLIFSYPETGQTHGGSRCLSNEEYFILLGRKLIQVLNMPTAEGLVYRVDMRLRPFGDSGPLVMGFDAMEAYYQSHGREWERYAWIKAKPITGDTSAGIRLMDTLRPFVYRRYLDFGVYESLREMKALIETEVKRKGLEDNIKLGPGGIREIEFVGQAFQLIRGGREPDLRVRSLLTVLRRLVIAGHLPAYVGNDLSHAYKFLRRTENRLQACNDEQIHKLPQDEIAQIRLAYAMGYQQWTHFERALHRHRRRVQECFEQIFAAPQGQTTMNDLTQLWKGALQGEAAIRVLIQSGFDAGEQAWHRIVQFKDSTAYRRIGNQGRVRLDQLIPLLLGAVTKAPAPLLALQRVFSLIERIASRTAYLALLVENPLALSQLVRLCANSSWIASLLTQHPLLLDELLDPRSLYQPVGRQVMLHELKEDLARLPEEDLEQQMEMLRHFRQAHVLKVAAADLAGLYPLMKVSDHLTEIAEVTLSQVSSLASSYMKRQYGVPWCLHNGQAFEPGFAIVAYGKLGGIELGYGSDLDLVFLHGSEGEERGTDGFKPLENRVYFSRLGQRIIHMVTAHTPAGVLYEIDMRLRPSGNAGLLVSSLQAYASYQRQEAWTWEHQALVRARVVVGDTAVTDAFTRLRHEILARPRILSVLRKQVWDMRDRMRRELGNRDPKRFNLKQDVGGIADIEFMVQYGVLAWAHRYAALLNYTDNIRLLEQFAAHGLMPVADATLLCEIYRAYRTRIHRLTLQDEPITVSAEEFLAYRLEVTRIWREFVEKEDEMGMGGTE